VPRVPPHLAHSPLFSFRHICAATPLDAGAEASAAAAEADRAVERAVWPRAGEDATVRYGPGTANGVPPPPREPPADGATRQGAAPGPAPPPDIVGRVSAGLRSAGRAGRGALLLPERAVRAHLLEASYAPHMRACLEGARPSTRAVPTLVRL